MAERFGSYKREVLSMTDNMQQRGYQEGMDRASQDGPPPGWCMLRDIRECFERGKAFGRRLKQHEDDGHSIEGEHR
jgi:hypothetical protein